MTGKEVKALRRQMRLTQRELAERTNMNKDTICTHETTKRDLSLVNKADNTRLCEFFKQNVI